MTEKEIDLTRWRCVFCGALAVLDSDGGVIVWTTTIAMDPDCEHETIGGAS